jgi:hypothetical protein
MWQRNGGLLLSKLLPGPHFALLASITIRAIVIESLMIDRTRGLLFCISPDSTRASFTAAISPATTDRAPTDLSAETAAESGARKQSVVRYCRASSQCWHFTTGLCSTGLISPGTLHGRARVGFPQAAQTVCQCRYGALSFTPSASPLKHAHDLPGRLTKEDFRRHNV